MPFDEGEEQEFLSPGDVDAQVPESPPSSPAPGGLPTPTSTDVTGGPEDEEPREPAPLFDPALRERWAILTQIGYLKSEPLDFLGHTFVLKTLDIDTILEVGLLHAEFQGTIADLKAYQALLAGASVVKLDGKPISVPIGEDDNDLGNRFNVVRKWFPATLDFVYEEYLKLEAQVDEIVAAMQAGHSLGGASGKVDSTPGLSPASA